MYNKELKKPHNRLFSNLGYSGIFSDKFELKWSDAPELFRKLASVKSTTASKMHAEKSEMFFEQQFTYNKVKYLASFHPITSFAYLCRIYPEEYFLKFAYSDLYTSIAEIRKDAVGIAADINILKEALAAEDMLDKYRDMIDEYLLHAEAIMSSAKGISDMFDISHLCEYVLITEKLSHTSSKFGKYNVQLGRSVDFTVNIKKSVARINYTVFESALIGIGKILYLILDRGDEAFLHITEKQNGSLAVYASAPYKADFDFVRLDHDIKMINCLFECLCGESKFFRSDDKLTVKATVPAYLSNYVNRIKAKDELYAEFDEYGRELTGFHSFISQRNGKVEFHCPKEELAVDISDVLADVILGELIDPEYPYLM